MDIKHCLYDLPGAIEKLVLHALGDNTLYIGQETALYTHLQITQWVTRLEVNMEMGKFLCLCHKKVDREFQWDEVSASLGVSGEMK